MMNSDYFSDEKRYHVYYSNPKSASHKFPRLSQQTLALSARDLEPKDKRQRQSDKASVYAGLLNEMSSSGSYSSDSPYFSFPQRSGKSVTSSPTSTTPSSPISSLNGTMSHNGRAQYNSLPSSISLTGVMPVFASSQESQYGRPVKLTTRVQQMFKDRQFNRGSRMTPASSSTSFPINHEDRNSIDMLDEEEHDEEHSDGDFNSSISENEDEVPTEDDAESENQDNNVWCVCQQKSEGDMVACDNKTCPFEWFHYECVGITAPPRGKWYCPECTKNLRRSRSIETR